MDTYKVYALLDERNRVLRIESSAFPQHIDDITKWTYIDEGNGERYGHAQGHYLDKPVCESRGIPQYKYVNGQIAERTKAEIDADYEPVEPSNPQAETDEMLLDHEERLILLEVGE